MNYSLYEPHQAEEIQRLFEKTFTDSEGEEEGKLIGELAKDFIQLTEAKDLYVFVAMQGEKVVGSIIFSRLICEDGTNAFLMAPVAVHSDYHGRGIGQGLINFALETLREAGVTLALTYGDINFYSKTGFVPISEDLVRAPLPLSYPEGWLGQSLVGDEIKPVQGRTECVEAIHKKVYW